MSDHRSMQLSHRFGNPNLERTLETFLDIVGGALGERLVSVVLYGCVVFDDLAPGLSARSHARGKRDRAPSTLNMVHAEGPKASRRRREMRRWRLAFFALGRRHWRQDREPCVPECW